MKTPELDKMRGSQPVSQQIGNFLSWLEDNGMVICETNHAQSWGGSAFQPVRLSIEQMLARYLNIDLDRAEDERVAVLRAFTQS